MEKIGIIGAGLCGTLLAIRLSQRGCKVSLIEKLADMRLANEEGGRSINLALSDRGLKALRLVGLEDYIKQFCIPMRGRLIHHKDGSTHFSPYSGRSEDYINSVSRSGLNIALLNMAEEEENISLYFDHKCIDANHHDASLRCMNLSNNEEIEFKFDLIFGTDGAGSIVRRGMIAHSTELLFNYSQDFLRHGYKELSIPPGDGGSFRIEKNALHIWPRGDYMVIALPNLDGSFTVTMFHPFDGRAGFNTLNDPNKLVEFFKEEYPDIIEHMPQYAMEYFENPTGILGTIKCYPWQAFGKACLLGDAAHAIVPFYGQGMNASFEDVTILDQILEDHSGDWEQTLSNYQDIRKADTDAIADLAIDNFYEMRDHVDDENFIKKRKLEMELESKFPDYYSKYSLVTFKEDLSYSEAMRKGRRQDEWLLNLCSNIQYKDMSLEQIFDEIQKI